MGMKGVVERGVAVKEVEGEQTLKVESLPPVIDSYRGQCSSRSSARSPDAESRGAIRSEVGELRTAKSGR